MDIKVYERKRKKMIKNRVAILLKIGLVAVKIGLSKWLHIQNLKSEKKISVLISVLVVYFPFFDYVIQLKYRSWIVLILHIY